MKLPYRAWTAVLVVAGTLGAWHRETEADLFFHLGLGREVLRHGARTIPEPSAFLTFAPNVVVPAWLWDMGVWSIWSAAGETGLAIFTLASAALASLLIALLSYRYTRETPFVVFAVVSGAALTVAVTRFAMRPQLTFMALLPGFLLLAQLYRDSAGPRRRAMGIAQAMTALVWPQVHGSFVMAPCLLFLRLAVGFRERSMGERREDGILFAVVLASLLTSSAGVDVLAYILEHSGGYDTRYIQEMTPPDLSALPVLAPPWGKALTLLWALAAIGLVGGREVRWFEVALAALGLLLFLRLQRFTAVDALLTIPLAALGASDLGTRVNQALSPSVRRAGSILVPGVTVLVLGLQVQDMNRTAGGGLGLARDAYPILGTRYVEQIPDGTNVLTSFLAGSYLGFFSDGRVRTYVDGRTAMYFDDSDFGLSHEVLGHRGALARGVDRWSVGAAVVDRAGPACETLRKRWIPVAIDAQFSTFVPRIDEPGIQAVSPCGERLLGPDVCTNGGDLLALDIARLKALGDVPSNSLLEAGHAILCRGEYGDHLRELLDRSSTPYLTKPSRRLRIAWHLFRGESADALALLKEATSGGDFSVVPMALSSAATGLDAQGLREVLQETAWAMQGATPPALRARIAQICMQLGDVECMRFHGQRAAVRGESSVMPVLEWLASNHPDPRVRADVVAWARRIHQTVPPGEAAPSPAPEHPSLTR